MKKYYTIVIATIIAFSIFHKTINAEEFSYIEKADLLYDEENYEEAAKIYNKAVTSLSTSWGDKAVAYYWLSYCYYYLEKYKESIEAATNHLIFSPDDKYSYVRRGDAYYGLKMYEEAIIEYTKALELNSDLVWALDYHYYRGNACKEAGNFKEAIDDFKKVIEISSKETRAYNDLAWLLLTCPDGKYRDGAQAVELAKKTVDIEPSFFHFDTLAAAYAENGEFEKAVEIAQQALELAEDKAEYIKLVQNYKNNRTYLEFKGQQFAHPVSAESQSEGEESNFYPGSEPTGFGGIEWSTDLNKIDKKLIFDGTQKKLDVYRLDEDKLLFGNFQVDLIGYAFQKNKFIKVDFIVNDIERYEVFKKEVFNKFGKINADDDGYYIWYGPKSVAVLGFPEIGVLVIHSSEMQ